MYYNFVVVNDVVINIVIDVDNLNEFKIMKYIYYLLYLKLLHVSINKLVYNDPRPKEINK